MYSKTYHTQDITKHTFLVTGGAGFIGSNIVEYLLKYNAGKVKVLDNLSTGFKENLLPFMQNPDFEFIDGDICNSADCYKACEFTDYVFHQAALGSVPRSVKDPVATNRANVDGFLNIIWAAKENNVKRVVYASSSSVYGDSPHMPKKEALIGNPISPYAVSKRVNELYASVFALNYGLEIAGLRYFNVFGPRQNPKGPYAAAIPLFMAAIFKNKPPRVFGDGEQTRDFTFVENVVQANIKAMFTKDPDIFGKVFNIACGEKTSINQLFSILKTFAGSELKPDYVSERPGDIRHSLADITAASQAISYQPEIKIEDGLKITFDWFKQNPDILDEMDQ